MLTSANTDQRQNKLMAQRSQLILSIIKLLIKCVYVQFKVCQVATVSVKDFVNIQN